MFFEVIDFVLSHLKDITLHFHCVWHRKYVIFPNFKKKSQIVTLYVFSVYIWEICFILNICVTMKMENMEIYDLEKYFLLFIIFVQLQQTILLSKATQTFQTIVIKEPFCLIQDKLYTGCFTTDGKPFKRWFYRPK